MENIVDRFLRYVKTHTMSDPSSDSYPSTNIQFDLANILCKELIELGLDDAEVDENCYVTATLKSNCNSESFPVIGFVAHLDTSPDFTAKDVKPKVVTNYNGKDILLNKEENIVLSVKDSPELLNYVGQDIITTDGTTLLGADDKAGIAIIMDTILYLTNNKDIKHGNIKICFTPDEEIGRGADRFDVNKFGADFAYTIDGSEIGELEYETFNAAGCKVTIKGKNVHPGYAKNKMINAGLLAMEFNSLLPANERPEHTEGVDGFYHLIGSEGSVENAWVEYIIRDFDADIFDSRIETVNRAVAWMNRKYGENTVSVQFIYQYRNMREKIEPVKYIVDLAEKAMIKADIKPIIKPIRGGTDGARLSFMGLPTPNIFAGGHNFHSRFEFVPIKSMEKCVEVLTNIIQLSKDLKQ